MGNKKVSSLRLTYEIQWGRERIIESKVGEIVQGHSLNLMVDMCLDNDKSSTTKVRKGQFVLMENGCCEHSY